MGFMTGKTHPDHRCCKQIIDCLRYCRNALWAELAFTYQNDKLKPLQVEEFAQSLCLSHRSALRCGQKI